MKPLLLHARPLKVSTGTRIDCHVGSALTAHAYGLNGVAWRPAMAERPSITVELMSLDLDGRVRPARMTVAISTNQLDKSVKWQALKWIGAPITLYSVESLSWATRVVEFSGEVRSHRLDIEDGNLRLTCEVSTTQLERNVLFSTFDGAGGLDGEPEMRGQLLPAGFGVVEGIEPIWFDKTRWIGMLDGYANLVSVQKLMEGAADMGPSVGNYATYDALAAAIDDETIPPGRWGTCIAYGLVGLGAPPFGTIGVNATFGSNRLGQIIGDLAQLHAALPAGNIDQASLNALDAAVPYNVHLWISEQREVKQVIEALAASGNATPILLPDNRLAVTRAGITAPVATLDRSGRQHPRVIDWQVADPVPPFWQIKARAARPANVLTYDEVNYEDDIIDRGAYDAGTTYRQGNLVWKGGASYLYINALPGEGHALPVPPAQSNAYWQALTPAPTAGDLTYADGTFIEDLKPAELGATEGAPVGTPVGDRPAEEVTQTIDQHELDLTNQVDINAAQSVFNTTIEEDITTASDDIDDLFLVFGDTDSAAQSAQAAATSEGLAAEYAILVEGQARAVELSKNASFDAPITLDSHASDAAGTQLPTAAGWTFSASYQSRSNVLHSTGAKVLYGSLSPYLPGRTYRLRVGIRHSASNIQSALGFACYDAAGAYLGVAAPVTHTTTVGFVDREGAQLSDANVLAGTKSIKPRLSTNFGSVAGEVGIDYLYLEDVTEQIAAQTEAGYAEDQAVIATDQAAAAFSSRELTASYASAAPGQTPNPNFDLGKTHWFDGSTLVTSTALSWDVVASFVSSVNVIRRFGARADIRGTPLAVSPTRKYRVRARFYVNQPNTIMYIGHTIDDGAGGDVALKNSVTAGGSFAAGWHEVQSDIITGSTGAATSFNAATKRAAPFAFANFNGASTTFAFDYFYLVDVTAEEAAVTAANEAGIAYDEQVIATNAAAAASTSQQLTAKVAATAIMPYVVGADTHWKLAAADPFDPGGRPEEIDDPALGGGDGGAATIPLNTQYDFAYTKAVLPVAPGGVLEVEAKYESRNAGGAAFGSLQVSYLDANYNNVAGTGQLGASRSISYTPEVFTERFTVPANAAIKYARVGVRKNSITSTSQLAVYALTAQNITDYSELEADVIFNAGVIAGIQNTAAFYEVIVAAGGGNPAMVQLLAGELGSRVGIVADQIALGNEIDGIVETVFTIENGQARINDAIIRRLRVAPTEISEIVHEVQLKPIILLASDGQAVQYQGGASYGQAPDRIEIDIAGASLPALAEGESYDIRAKDITATGFNMRAKKLTAAGSATQTSAAGTNVGGTPQWQTNKPTAANAKDDLYQFNGVATLTQTSTQIFVEDETANPPVYRRYSTYSGTVKLYGKIGAAWTLLATRTISRSLGDIAPVEHPATQNFSFATVIQSGADFGSGAARFGLHPGTAPITDFTSVTYSTQTTSGETAVGGNFKVTVYPPTGEE